MGSAAKKKKKKDGGSNKGDCLLIKYFFFFTLLKAVSIMREHSHERATLILLLFLRDRNVQQCLFLWTPSGLKLTLANSREKKSSPSCSGSKTGTRHLFFFFSGECFGNVNVKHESKATQIECTIS